MGHYTRADEITEQVALPLALAIVKNGDLLPRERGPYVLGGTIMQAGILVYQLMKRISPQARHTAVEAVIQGAELLVMGGECVRWLTHSPDRSEQDRVLPDEADDIIYQLFAIRVQEASADQPLFLNIGRDAPELYWYWQKGRGQAEVEAHLKSFFDTNPSYMNDFLDSYVGEGWEIESGLPVRSDLRRETYDAIALCISPDYVMKTLHTLYGAELDAPRYHIEGSTAQKFAHQFAYIHQAVVEKSQAQKDESTPHGV